MNRKCCLTNCNDNAWEGISSYCERHYMERQNKTKTCGEISCEECNERYEQALITIDRLQSELSQAQEVTARRCAELGGKTRRDVHDAITSVVASQLHYFDMVDTVNLNTCSYQEIMEMTNGTIERYRNDPRFHARVASMVANIMQTLFTANADAIRKEYGMKEGV